MRGAARKVVIWQGVNIQEKWGSIIRHKGVIAIMEFHPARPPALIVVGTFVGISLCAICVYFAVTGGRWLSSDFLWGGVYDIATGTSGGIGVFSAILWGAGVQPSSHNSSSRAGKELNNHNLPENQEISSDFSRDVLQNNSRSQPLPIGMDEPPIKTRAEFAQAVIKLANIATECEELVEEEKILVKKEAVRLSLRRREFKKLFTTIKQSPFESF